MRLPATIGRVLNVFRGLSPPLPFARLQSLRDLCPEEGPTPLRCRAGNSLTELPKDLLALTALEKLSLSSNKITVRARAAGG